MFDHHLAVSLKVRLGVLKLIANDYASRNCQGTDQFKHQKVCISKY